MVSRKQELKATARAEEAYEDREGSGRLARIMTAVALYGITLLLGYIALATPQKGTAMGAIRDVLSGLGGSCAILIPAMLAWIATLVARAAADKKVSIWKSAVDGLLFICAFTVAQLLVAETVVQTKMTISGFANFVDKSYAYGRGGGAIGALLAWPLYSYLGTWGGILAALLLALLSLTATGKAARAAVWIRDRAQTVQHDTEQRRRVRENDRMFEVEPPQPRRRPMEPRSREGVYIPTRHPEGSQDGRPMEPRSREGVYIPTRHPEGSQDDARRTEPRRRENPEGMAQSNGRMNAGEGARRPRAAQPRTPAEAGERMSPKPANRRPAQPQSAPESLIDDAPMPDAPAAPEMEMPGTAAFEGSPDKKKRDFKPDIPQAVEAMRREKAKDGQISIEEDLTIEPEKCDVLEEDAPPFDMPERVRKPLPKLKRPTHTEAPADDEDAYNYPPIDLLAAGDGVTENHREADMEKAALLEEVLSQFNISTRLTGIAHGPAVTRFELAPAPGVKVSRITALSDDIAMHLAALSVRIEAPIPGKAAVGVEIPNEKVEMVRLRDVLESAEARKSVSKIAVGLGKDNSGRYIVADIAKMPHVLIAGQTGSGKSVCINSIITSILFRATPEEVRLILIDPKVVELSIYNDIPHLICPVVTDCKKAASALDWAVSEMSMRYKRFAERGVRDIKGYNKALKDGEKPMPQMVIIIDELADLMMVAPGEVEDSICRLAQLARAAGMHLVIATQRPSVNVITGIIKANIPTRIAFSVASQVDSRTMIDHGGAEKLLGNGDMLFVPSGINKPMRVQGAWVSDEEVHAVVSYIKERSTAAYDADMIEQMDNAARTDAEKEEFSAEYDPRLPEAVEIVVEAGQASVSMLQRRMRVGYARAGRLIDEMEQRGIVSEADGAKPRSVLITREEMDLMFEGE